MEGQTLYGLVVGRIYDAELRKEMLQLGIKRISNQQFISKTTATRYELILSGEEGQRVVTGVDVIDDDQRIHLVDPNAEPPAPEDPGVAPGVPAAVHHKTISAIYRQLEISGYYYDLIDRWNNEIYKRTALGLQLQELVKSDHITWEDFIFLPDPLASGEYLFGAIHEGKAAAIHAWLNLPDGRYIVPTNGTPDGAFDSLQCGKDFHAWEFQAFETAAAAGQYAIRMLNTSDTTYAQAIRALLGKEKGNITRNDFHRNADKEMARIDIIRDERGVTFLDVPVVPTIADCIDSLLAPYIKANVLNALAEN